MHLHLQHNRNRLPVQGSRLIFPLQYRLQRRAYQQRMSAHNARLYHVPLLVDHCVNDYGSSDVCFEGQWRIFRIDVIGLTRCFNPGASADDSLCRLRLRGRRRDCCPRAAESAADRPA